MSYYLILLLSILPISIVLYLKSFKQEQDKNNKEQL